MKALKFLLYLVLGLLRGVGIAGPVCQKRLSYRTQHRDRRTHRCGTPTSQFFQKLQELVALERI